MVKILRGGMVFDPERATLERADIAIDGAAIQAVSGPQAPLNGVDDVDVSGMTVLPGLINLHVHLEQLRTWGPVQQQLRLNDVYLVIRSVKAALALLKQGFTTVRDLGAKHNINIHMKRAINARLIPGPRVLAAGSFITISGGKLSLISTEADGPSAIRRAVRQSIKSGADWIKLLSTNDPVEKQRNGQFSHPGFTRDEYAAAVDTAHVMGRRVACHAMGRDSIEWALEAGIDTLEHGVYLDAALARRMARDQVPLVPTLSVYHQATLPVWGYGTEVATKQLIEPHHVDSVKHAVAEGVRIGIGTDTNGDLLEELEMLVACGMTAGQVLRAATLDGARVLGLEDQIGSIEPGKIADLIVVRGNPLTDLGSVREIEWVFQSGVGRRPDGITIPTEAERSDWTSLSLLE